MDNKSYPAWAAVFLIPALFTYVTIRFAVQGKPVEKAWIIGGLAATVTLGAIIWLLDSPRRNKTETTEVDHWTEVIEEEGGELVPRFLTFISLLLFFIPIIGLALSVSAVIANWKRPGWSQRLSRLSLILSTLATLAIAILLLPGK